MKTPKPKVLFVEAQKIRRAWMWILLPLALVGLGVFIWLVVLGQPFDEKAEIVPYAVVILRRMNEIGAGENSQKQSF